MAEKLSDRYNPQEVESKIYKWWEESGHFKSQDKSTKPPFSIILPPPNVTGYLHIGHALDHTIQDLLIRWKRMSGFNTMWLPGTDHAGIATQSVVERELKKEGITRHQLGREKFVEKVWDWKNLYGDRITEQMRRLGDSCDWERLTFTLDPNVSTAVRKVFVTLYKKGLIYRGKRLVNWSGPLETAISDVEVEHKQVKGAFYYINYQLEDKSGSITIATTRPETLLGDTAVCVHPTDERYKAFIGKNLILPLLGRKIPVIADETVEKDFGTGALKITPAHDFNDYNIGKKHKLEMINILTTKAEINENGGQYAGLKVVEARKKVVEDLKAQGLLVKEEPHVHSVGHCSRSGAVAEPFLSEQWFVKMEPLAAPAKRCVENGTIKITPENWIKTYLHWMNNIEDWCISRQLWWGHRIPAWHCEACEHITISEVNALECEKCKSKNIKQEEDVLDTWFSSGLWPFSTMGWPKETETLKTFYPTSVLVTGHDIIFFWVARMIMLGLEFQKDVPFRHVYLHGIVRDAQGNKVSKSSGNAMDPIDLIEKNGADALRFTLLSSMSTGKDLKFSEQRLETNRNFMNKIWNAARFALTHLESFTPPQEMTKALPNKDHLSIYDKWIVFKTASVIKTVEDAMESDRYSDAAQALYSFVWHDFCDWYIELTKVIFNSDHKEQKQATQLVMAQTLNRIVRLLHPFIPFISEEIYQKLPIKGAACIVDAFPTQANDKAWLSLGSEKEAFEVDLVKEIITAVRNIRGENRISPALKLKIRLIANNEEAGKILNANLTTLTNLARLEDLQIGVEGSLSKCAVSLVTIQNAQVKVIIPLEGLVDIDEEIKRIQKNLEKLNRDLTLLTNKLNNKDFVANALEEVIENDKRLLVQTKAQIVSNNEALERLKA